MSILETIDNAVRDWETSDDAMRWTPEPQPVLMPLLPQITPEQVEHMRDAINQAMRPITAQFHEVARVMGVYLKEHIAPVIRALARLQAVEQRPPRISAMRRAYRHKTRHRW